MVFCPMRSSVAISRMVLPSARRRRTVAYRVWRRTWAVWRAWRSGAVSGRVAGGSGAPVTRSAAVRSAPCSRARICLGCRECLDEVLEEMEAIRHLNGLGGTTRGAFREAAATGTAHHGNARLHLEPLSQGVRLASWQQIEHTVAFEVDEDRPVALPTPESPVVDADDAWGGDQRQRSPVYLAHLAEHGSRAGSKSEGHEQARARFTAQGEAHGAHPHVESLRSLSIGRHKTRQDQEGAQRRWCAGMLVRHRKTDGRASATGRALHARARQRPSVHTANARDGTVGYSTGNGHSPRSSRQRP